MEDCEAIQYISPLYFASFVLLYQFILLNVVVAVLMKHLEESKSKDKITINEQSLRTTKLFLERGFPTKNSTSMRCHKIGRLPWRDIVYFHFTCLGTKKFLHLLPS